MKAARGNAFLDLSASVELINGMSCAEERWYLIYCRYSDRYGVATVLSGRSLTAKERQAGGRNGEPRGTKGDFPRAATRPTASLSARCSYRIGVATRHANESPKRCEADTAIATF